MTEPETVEFVLDGTIAGQTVSATGGVPFTRFLEYNEEVQRYVRGSDEKSVLRDVTVQVHDGSYKLLVLIPAGLLSSLIADSTKLGETGELAGIDPDRASVVLRWQERAKSEPTLKYAVRSPRGAFAPVVISKDSMMKREERVQWVAVERYLVGEITDWGGSQTPNVHLRPRNSRETLIVDATADQIRGQRENLVYHKAIVHVKAKQNPRTGELKGYKLIELKAYKPEVTDTRLQELFERGAKAWTGVTDSAAWVEEMRGGSHG